MAALINCRQLLVVEPCEDFSRRPAAKAETRPVGSVRFPYVGCWPSARTHSLPVVSPPVFPVKPAGTLDWAFNVYGVENEIGLIELSREFAFTAYLFYFKHMRKNLECYICRGLSIFAVIVFMLSTQACGQASSSVLEPANKPQLPKPGKTVFRDSGGNEISNNEFVDIRMANFHDKDATKMALLDDGTTEFRLQAVPQEGTLAPPLAFTTTDGRNLTADDLKGKVLVLNFWFIGCPGCLEEMPKLNAAMRKFGSNENVLFIAVTFDPIPKLTKFLAREKFDYLMVAGAQSTLNRFHFSGYPKNIVIGKDGRIVYWRSTVRALNKFSSVIQAELNKN